MPIDLICSQFLMLLDVEYGGCCNYKCLDVHHTGKLYSNDEIMCA